MQVGNKYILISNPYELTQKTMWVTYEMYDKLIGHEFILDKVTDQTITFIRFGDTIDYRLFKWDMQHFAPLVDKLEEIA